MSSIVILGHSSSTHTNHWARAMKQRGYDISVISYCGESIGGIETLIFGREPAATIGYFKYLRSVKKKLAEIRPDLIHVFQATGYGHWGAGYNNCQKILTGMGSDIVITGRKSPLHKWYLNSVLKKYDHFTAPSQYLKEEMNNLFKVTDSKTEVIPFGVEIPENCVSYKASDTVKLVYMKNLKPVYGPDVLIKALAILKDRDISFHLDMFGVGVEKDRIESDINDLGLAGKISFWGFIPHREVAGRYLDYDIMIMPSRSESFGVAAVEASAVGLPVVASNVGGIPEVVLHEQTGILVPSDDPKSLAEAVMRLASDAELRKKMGEAGRKHVIDNFEWQECVSQMDELYRKLIQ